MIKELKLVQRFMGKEEQCRKSQKGRQEDAHHRRKTAGIEPVIGHCKSDHSLGRNYWNGLFGDSINVMLAAAAFNFKRAMRALLYLLQKVLSGWIKPFMRLKNLYFWQVPSCYADMRTRELAF